MKNIHPEKELSFVKQPESKKVLLSVGSEEQSSSALTQLPPDYNMVYLNISDSEILSQSSLIPNINLYNSLDSLQESATVFFNIEPNKPDMVDPNEVLEYKLAKTASESSQSDPPLVPSDPDVYTVNLSDIPISIINSSGSGKCVKVAGGSFGSFVTLQNLPIKETAT